MSDDRPEYGPPAPGVESDAPEHGTNDDEEVSVPDTNTPDVHDPERPDDRDDEPAA